MIVLAALTLVTISCSDAPLETAALYPQMAAKSRFEKNLVSLGGGKLRIEKVSGDTESGPTDSVLADSIVVRVYDNRSGVGGVTVQWAVRQGGGWVSPATSVTDAVGVAKTAWTMGTVGTGSLEATASGAGSVSFTATSTSVQPPAAAIKVTPSSAALDALGAQVNLVAAAYDADGVLLVDAGFSWSSLEPAVAGVDRAGVVTAAGAGKARIVVQAGSAADTVAITVTLAGAYFVSTTGSNGNPGTESAPWRTIAYGLSRLQPGNTLYVRGGTYMENVKNPTIQSGRMDARIRVAAYPGERPVIEGLLWVMRPNYWTFDGINVTWSSVNGPTDHMVKITNGIGWIYENSEVWGARSFAGMLVYGSVTGEPSNWIVRRNCIHDVFTSPTYAGSQDHNLYVNTGLAPGPGLIERNILFNAPNGTNLKLGYGRSDPQPTDGTANVTVRYNTMFSSLKNILVADASHSNTIEHNIVQYSNDKYAIRAYRLTGENNTFRNNVFYQFNRLQYGDTGYSLVADGGGNIFPRDPQFNAVSCSGFRPGDTVVQSYGRWAP